ncbi:hypothetical protein BaRGS_00020217, partial [Batillaria attramentaria]
MDSPDQSDHSLDGEDPIPTTVMGSTTGTSDSAPSPRQSPSASRQRRRQSLPLQRRRQLEQQRQRSASQGVILSPENLLTVPEQWRDIRVNNNVTGFRRHSGTSSDGRRSPYLRSPRRSISSISSR